MKTIILLVVSTGTYARRHRLDLVFAGLLRHYRLITVNIKLKSLMNILTVVAAVVKLQTEERF